MFAINFPEPKVSAPSTRKLPKSVEEKRKLQNNRNSLKHVCASTRFSQSYKLIYNFKNAFTKHKSSKKWSKNVENFTFFCYEWLLKTLKWQEARQWKQNTQTEHMLHRNQCLFVQLKTVLITNVFDSWIWINGVIIMSLSKAQIEASGESKCRWSAWNDRLILVVPRFVLILMSFEELWERFDVYVIGQRNRVRWQMMSCKKFNSIFVAKTFLKLKLLKLTWKNIIFWHLSVDDVSNDDQILSRRFKTANNSIKNL